jgi:hypothetical protein
MSEMNRGILLSLIRNQRTIIQKSSPKIFQYILKKKGEMNLID